MFVIEQKDHPALPTEMALKKSLIPFDFDFSTKIQEIIQLDKQMQRLMKPEMKNRNLLEHFGWEKHTTFFLFRSIVQVSNFCSR